MTFQTKTLATRLSIEEIVSKVEDIQRLVAESYRAIEMAEQVKATLGNTAYILPPYIHREYQSDIQQRITASSWRYIVALSGFSKFADSQALDKLHEELEKNPPAFTLENIRTTLLSWEAQKEELYLRSIRGLYERLSPKHKTIQMSKGGFPKRLIIQHFVRIGWSDGFKVEYHAENLMNDFGRIISSVIGQEHVPKQLLCDVNAGWKTSAVYEDTYLMIKAHQNGNAHLTIKSEALRERLNTLLAQAYGANLTQKAA